MLYLGSSLVCGVAFAYVAEVNPTGQADTEACFTDIPP